MKLFSIAFAPNYLKLIIEKHKKAAPIIKNIFWLFAQKGLNLPLGLFVGMLVARYLGPENFGLLSYSVAITALFQPISQLGINSILTRDLVENTDKSEEILGTAFVLRFCGGCLSLLLITLYILFLEPGEQLLKSCIFLLALRNLFQPFQVIDFWFRSQVISKNIVITNSCILVAGGIFRLLMLYKQASVLAFIIILCGEHILANVLLILPYSLKKNSVFSWKFNHSRAKNLMAQSWPLILSGFGSIIYLKIDQVMLGSMSTKEILGNYALATRLSETWYFIPTAVVSSVFPSLLISKQQGTKAYHEKLQKLYDYLALLAMFIAVPTTFFATPIIMLIYGNSYRSAGLILSIHIWAGVFIFMRAALSKWLIAENLLMFSLVTHGFGAIVNVVLNLLFIPSFGGIGAAIATVISYATSSYISLFISRKTITMAKMMTYALLSPVRLTRKIFI